jgi:hypothetical protein
MSSTPDQDARVRVRRLLLSGDNTRKNRDDEAGADRARARYEEALAVAREAGLEDEIVEIIRRRLPPQDHAPVD